MATKRKKGGDKYDEMDFEKAAVAQLYSMIAKETALRVMKTQVLIIEQLREDSLKQSTDLVLEHSKATLFRLIKHGADAQEIKLQAEVIQRLKAALTPSKFRRRLVLALIINVTRLSSSSKGQQRARTHQAEETRTRQSAGERAPTDNT
jgi:hypothetical protein